MSDIPKNSVIKPSDKPLLIDHCTMSLSFRLISEAEDKLGRNLSMAEVERLEKWCRECCTSEQMDIYGQKTNLTGEKRPRKEVKLL